MLDGLGRSGSASRIDTIIQISKNCNQPELYTVANRLSSVAANAHGPRQSRPHCRLNLSGVDRLVFVMPFANTPDRFGPYEYPASSAARSSGTSLAKPSAL